MIRRGCLLLLVVVASTRTVHASSHADWQPRGDSATPTATSTALVPTVTILHSTSSQVPTVTIPQPAPAPIHKPKPKKIKVHHRKPAAPSAPKAQYTWITAFLTSYCPGSAGWLSSSGQPVFYGMLANNFYNFGTHVYIPTIGITGVVEDRLGAYAEWNHFDVWSAVCYSTPTGWFKVGVAG